MRLIDADKLLDGIINPYERITISRWLDDAPTVDAVPEKRGKWEPYRCDMYICSECGHVYTELSSMEKCEANYCPNCGADMRGERHDVI